MSQSVPDAVAAEALRLLGPFPENWVPAWPGIDHDVFVVGGGHTGSTFAFAPRRAGIGRVNVIDAAPDEAASGVWLTRARRMSPARFCSGAIAIPRRSKRPMTISAPIPISARA